MTATTASAAAPGTAVSSRLADHIAGTRFDDLPASVVEKTKELLAYHVALAIAGCDTAAAKHAVALAYQLSAGAGRSTILGHDRPATLLDAIFAHSELIGALSATDEGSAQDDVHLPSKMTPARASHGVAWVVGERERASGRELITAVAVGYDAGCKLGETVVMAGDYSRVPHKFAFAPFVAAAVAARLLGQDRERTAHTLAHAAHLSMGVNHGALIASATSMAARNGAMAAFLRPFERVDDLRAIEARHGMYAALFGGVPDGLDERLDTLGREFSILDAQPKHYPMSNSHYAPLEQTRGLLRRAGLRAGDVVSLVVTLPQELRGRFEFLESWVEGPSASRTDVVRSLRVKLAVLLVGGELVSRPTVAQFQDPRVRAALGTITLRYAPMPIDRAHVNVVTIDGRTLNAEGTYAPAPKVDVSALLRRDAERYLSRERLAELERQLAQLEDVRDAGAVLRQTVPDRSRR